MQGVPEPQRTPQLPRRNPGTEGSELLALHEKLTNAALDSYSFDFDVKEDDPTPVTEKPKRKLKRGDQKLTDFGHCLLGAGLSLSIGVLVMLLAELLPSLIKDIVQSYLVLQLAITVALGYVFCREAYSPVVITSFPTWQKFTLYSLTWLVSGPFLVWKQVKSSVFEKVG